MLLPMFDLATREWGAELPFPKTLAEAMFPDVAYALIHAGAQDVDAGTLAEGAAQAGYRLDFAGGGKKDGTFVMTSEPGAPAFWNTPEEAVAYGSILLTPCWGRAPERVQLRVAVMEDGELGTGDCHAKAGTALWYRLDADEDRAAQFRLGVKDEGFIAKGTMMLDSFEDGDDLDVDLVIPLSAFKSSRKPTTGTHTWDAYLGVVAWSEARPTNIGYQVLQWFSWEAVQADLLPAVEELAGELIAAMTNTRSLVAYLRLHAAEFELPLLDVFLADEKAMLSQHPYLVYKIGSLQGGRRRREPGPRLCLAGPLAGGPRRGRRRVGPRRMARGPHQGVQRPGLAGLSPLPGAPGATRGRRGS